MIEDDFRMVRIEENGELKGFLMQGVVKQGEEMAVAQALEVVARELRAKVQQPQMSDGDRARLAEAMVDLDASIRQLAAMDIDEAREVLRKLQAAIADIKQGK